MSHWWRTAHGRVLKEGQLYTSASRKNSSSGRNRTWVPRVTSIPLRHSDAVAAVWILNRSFHRFTDGDPAGTPFFSDHDDDRGWSERWLKRETFSGPKPMSWKSKVKVQNSNRYKQNAQQKSQLTQWVSTEAQSTTYPWIIPLSGYVPKTSRASHHQSPDSHDKERIPHDTGLCFD